MLKYDGRMHWADCACGWVSDIGSSPIVPARQFDAHVASAHAFPGQKSIRAYHIGPTTASGGVEARCPCGWHSPVMQYDFWNLREAFEAHVCLSTVKPGPLEQFDAAIQTVTQQRGEVYGHPAVDFDRAARLHAVVDECEDPLVRHALRMVCVKMARLIHSPDHMDSVIDGAGYFRTIALVLDKRAKDKP